MTSAGALLADVLLSFQDLEAALCQSDLPVPDLHPQSNDAWDALHEHVYKIGHEGAATTATREFAIELGHLWQEFEDTLLDDNDELYYLPGEAAESWLNFSTCVCEALHEIAR